MRYLDSLIPPDFLRKPFNIFFAFLFFASIALAVYHHRKKPQEPVVAEDVPIHVNVFQVHPGRFQEVLEVVGNIRGESEIDLHFETEGKIMELNIREGSRVKKGEVIARLQDEDAKLKVEEGLIELEEAERRHRVGDVDSIFVRKALLKLHLAQRDLAKTVMTAPMQGIIGAKNVDVGQVVTLERPIARLVSIRNVIVEAGILEKKIDQVYPGLTMQIRVDARPGEIFTGVINTVSPLIDDSGSRTTSVRALIPNPGYVLLPGMFVRGSVVIYQMDDVITIPVSALSKRSKGGYEVYVAGLDNIAVLRPVDIGYVSTEEVTVLEGLTAGELVVSQITEGLKDGVKIKVINLN